MSLPFLYFTKAFILGMTALEKQRLSPESKWRYASFSNLFKGIGAMVQLMFKGYRICQGGIDLD
ncbi:hypothetical protein QO000_003272 [Alkalihalobacillus hemicentroti]|uniref:Uncharacterized protein n=1 Tax=Guptibacillus hwajinpoensis TaxID=208199 RepID=A0ABU0K4K1_9BACL|nr:hypothetical protein [Alkalihalobacillus hemicentroti]